MGTRKLNVLKSAMLEAIQAKCVGNEIEHGKAGLFCALNRFKRSLPRRAHTASRRSS